jgi:hypothetical protein
VSNWSAEPFGDAARRVGESNLASTSVRPRGADHEGRRSRVLAARDEKIGAEEVSGPRTRERTDELDATDPHAIEEHSAPVAVRAGHTDRERVTSARHRSAVPRPIAVAHPAIEHLPSAR